MNKLEAVLAESNKKARDFCFKLFGSKVNYQKVFFPIMEGKNLDCLTEEQRRMFRETDLDEFHFWKFFQDEFWEKNKNFVKKITNDFIKKAKLSNKMYDDLNGEANIAFSIAIRMYSNSEYCFRTYLGRVIWITLTKYIERSVNGSGCLNRINIYRKTRNKLEAEGKAHEFNDVCNHLGWGRTIQKNTKRLLAQIDLESLGDTVVEDRRSSSNINELLEALNTIEMTELESDVLKSRAGDLFVDSMDMRDVAKKHGVPMRVVRSTFVKLRSKLSRRLSSF